MGKFTLSMLIFHTDFCNKLPEGTTSKTIHTIHQNLPQPVARNCYSVSKRASGSCLTPPRCHCHVTLLKKGTRLQQPVEIHLNMGMDQNE